MTVPEEAEALLTSEPLIAHLGTCHENEPHIASLWFNYREGSIEIATTGRKLANIRKNPHVALSIQKDENGHPRWGITIQGTASVIDDEEERQSVLRRINRKYGADEDAWSENTPVHIEIGSIDYWTY